MNIIATNFANLLRFTGPFKKMVTSLIATRIASNYRVIAKILQNVVHLYPAPTNYVKHVKDGNWLAFYNSSNVLSIKELCASKKAISSLIRNDSKRKRWLFILAEFDLKYQINKRRHLEFTRLVVAILEQVITNEKHVVLIAPNDFCAVVSSFFPNEETISFPHSPPFTEFTTWLLDAEVAFYWQFFSTSSFVHLLNDLPVFYFDQGHYSRLFIPSFNQGISSYFLGKAPEVIDIREPLDLKEVVVASQRFILAGVRLRGYMSSENSPEATIRALRER